MAQKKGNGMRILMLVGILVAVAAVGHAQDNARAVRDASLQMSRYEQMIGKLQDQNQQLQSDIRALQRDNDALAKDVQAANARSQNIADEMQRLKNSQLQNLDAAQHQLVEQVQDVKSKLWGDGQRDCPTLKVKHQQIKVMMNPDGTRSVRFLCFDGKPLLLGSEVYTPEGK